MEKERRRYLLSKGNKNKHSHLIIIIDRSEFIPDEIVRYVDRNEDIKNVLFKYVCNPEFEIWNIFNYDMDLEKQIKENRPYHIITPYNKMNDAYIYAKQKHKGQVRKDGSPYINHPVKVAEIVSEFFSVHPKINEYITASYLHDVVEDTDTTIDEIRDKFGDFVAYLVDGVTSDKTKKKIMGKTNYLCNKMLNMDEDVLNLKLCDRLANVLDLENADSDFKEKYEIETTVILNYLLTNKKLTDIQMKLIKIINKQINDLRKRKILKLANV